jgi:hypothetical protein
VALRDPFEKVAGVMTLGYSAWENFDRCLDMRQVGRVLNVAIQIPKNKAPSVGYTRE